MKTKEDNNKIRQNLEEQFKNLLPAEDAPLELKEEVFNTLDTLSLVGDIVDLFTTKFSESEATFLDVIQTPETESEAGDFSSEIN